MAGEDGVLLVEGNGADGALDGVVVDLDAAISEEAAQAVAVFGDLCESLAQGRFARDAGAVMGQPVVDAGEERGGVFPPDGQSGSGVAAADFGLDGIEIAEEAPPSSAIGAGDLDQLAARVRAAMPVTRVPGRADRCIHTSGIARDAR